MSPEHRKRKKRRSVAGYIIIICILLILMSLLIYEHFAPLPQKPVGTWIREVDITEEATKKADEWLTPALSGSSGIPEHNNAGISIDIILKIDPDGSYEQTVDEMSYDMARQAAYDDLSNALRLVVGERFAAIGLSDDDGLSDEELEDLMQEALGMSVDEYLKKAVDDIIPTLEHYTESYETSGTYSVDRENISFDGAAYSLLFDDNRMILNDAVYTRQSQNQ